MTRPFTIIAQKVQKLEEHRENLRVAYATSRHIERVRVVPKRHVQCPKRENFFEKGESGETTRFSWERYLGHVKAVQIIRLPS